MIDWKLGIALASASAGASSSVVLDLPVSEPARAIMIGVIIVFALFFGALARLATTEGDSRKERRRAMMTFGSLYVISLFMANKLNVDIYGAALLAVGVGAAGPLILVPLVEGVVGILRGMIRALKAFFDQRGE